MDTLFHLIDTLENEDEVVIFLGAGASMEGVQNDQHFPSFWSLINRILDDYNISEKDDQKRFNEFKKIIKKWEREDSLINRLSKYLDGKPGIAHYFLAALALSSPITDVNLCMVLTTNFDSLIDNAFRKFKVSTVSASLDAHHEGTKGRKFLQNLLVKAKKKIPVILKIFGDLTTKSPIFDQEDMEFDEVPKEIIQDWFNKPTLFIGYSFSDTLIRKLLLNPLGKKPIFIVDPADLRDDLETDQRVYHLRSGFYEFIEKLVKTLKNRNSIITREFDRILSEVEPSNFYNYSGDLRKKASYISQFFLQSYLPTFRRSGEKIIPVGRPQTAPDFLGFVTDSSARCMCIVGRSGSGKSSILFDLTNNQKESIFFISYSIHQIDHKGSLKEKLAEDLNCPSEKLEPLLLHIGSFLLQENKYLVVIVDAINESKFQNIGGYKIEIEELATRLPDRVKIIYSCRESTWRFQNYETASLPEGLYYKNEPQVLDHFSPEEAQNAFISYQYSFQFQGIYQELSDDMKVILREPIMLRIVSEIYEKQELPSTVPNQKLFQLFDQRWKARLDSIYLVKFVKKIVDLQLSSFFQNRRKVNNIIDHEWLLDDSEICTLIDFQKKDEQRPGDPIKILSNEGILTALPDETYTKKYCFIHDRYHELLLSFALERRFEIDSIRSFSKKIPPILDQITKDDLSVYEGLIIYMTRLIVDQHSESFRLSDLISILPNCDKTTYFFLVDVFRTVALEFRHQSDEILNSLSTQNPLLLLDVVGDGVESRKQIINCLFSGQKSLVRRSVQMLASGSRNSSFREFLDEVIIEKFRKESEVGNTENSLSAICYYTSVIFSIEDRFGENDVFQRVLSFWSSIFPDGFYKNTKKELCDILEKLVNEELVHFVPALIAGNSFDYLWDELEPDMKSSALSLAGKLDGQKAITDPKIINSITLFGSDKKSIDIGSEDYFTFRIEYKLAKWVLISRSKYDYWEVKEVLQSIVESKHWLSVDFCLCVMKYIIQRVYENDRSILLDAYESMRRWTIEFETNSKFYYPLSLENPFATHFNSLSQVSRIEAQYIKSETGEILFLADRLNSGNPDKIKMAVLSLRQLWRDHPDEVLKTLLLIFDSKDPLVETWVNQTLREISIVYPLKVNAFLRQVSVNLNRLHAIKFDQQIQEISGVEYFGEAFYEPLVFGNREILHAFQHHYEHLLMNCSSIREFCEYFIDYIGHLMVKIKP